MSTVPAELIELDLDEASEPPAGSRPPVSSLEWVLIALTNLVWAVLGGVLFVPFVLRTVVVASMATLHSALTDQPNNSARHIRAANSFYRSGFLGRQAFAGTGKSFRQREWRPLRFLIECGWAVVFWAVVLRELGWLEFSFSALAVIAFDRLGPAGAILARWGSWLFAVMSSRLADAWLWLLARGWASRASLALGLVVVFTLSVVVGRRLANANRRRW